MQLENRRIIVTGGASGIGHAIATLFLAHGAQVAVLDLHAGAPADAMFIRCDVTDEPTVQRAIAKAGAAFGGLDGVINGAGADLLRPFDQMSRHDWDRVLAINLTGPMMVCQAALTHMAGPGSIVNIASGAALRPLANRTAYCAAKAGLAMFTKTLALDLAPRDIRANVLCPGVIDTPMLRASWENADDPQAALAEITTRPALGRIGTVDDIAAAALYLTSAQAGFVTGTTLTVDGGRAFH
ncbi:SDR family NAD(P)-dependent oxidoreductase [Oceaniglobus ichthyenteri]|uniref:SDR family NAD(P)-dependent oxidoreductase n=1 Tax=Oceaniglobus ichthyenteri TaxID=2136177 RepID=UPI000D372AA4|nr:SDR family NAD(P)-dependent oxidoreductase [Oceaniglobus ichthyenteri]